LIDYVDGVKKENGCKYCEEDDPVCLDFHHRDPLLKEHEIGKMVSFRMGFDRIKKEISKCDVVCSNCHRKLHYKEKNERKER